MKGNGHEEALAGEREGERGVVYKKIHLVPGDDARLLYKCVESQNAFCFVYRGFQDAFWTVSATYFIALSHFD